MKQIIRVQYDGPPATPMQAAELLRRLVEYGWDAYQSDWNPDDAAAGVTTQLIVIDEGEYDEGSLPTFAVLQGEGEPRLTDIIKLIGYATRGAASDAERTETIEAADRLQQALGL